MVNARLAASLERVSELEQSHAGVPPAFMVVGAQKGGTTALASHLQDRTCMMQRELHIEHVQHWKTIGGNLSFWRDMYSWPRRMPFMPLMGATLAALHTCLTRNTSGWVSWGFSDPVLMYLAPAGFAASLSAIAPPGMQLVVLLREPIQRAHSHYEMLKLLPGDRKPRAPFEATALAALDHLSNGSRSNRWKRGTAGAATSMILRGVYAEQLAALLQHFRAERLYLAISECLLLDAAREYARLFAFLGLPTGGTLRNLTREESRSSSHAPLHLTTGAYARLFDFYHRSTEWLYRSVGLRVVAWDAWYDKHGVQTLSDGQDARCAYEQTSPLYGDCHDPITEGRAARLTLPCPECARNTRSREAQAG